MSLRIKSFLKRGVVFKPNKKFVTSADGPRVQVLKITNFTNKVICYHAFFSGVNSNKQVVPKFGFILPRKKVVLQVTKQEHGVSSGKLAVRVALGPKLDGNGLVPIDFEPKGWWIKRFGGRLTGQQKLFVYEKQFGPKAKSFWQRVLAFFRCSKCCNGRN